MNKQAEVVIIGGGVIGCSIAYFLTRHGCRDVLILERENFQGKHSTGRSAGGVRQQFATPVNIRMSRFSIDFFTHFEELTGQDPEYRSYGYLFIATEPAHVDYLQQNLRVQQAEGVPVEFLTREDIARLVPQLYVEDVLGGTYCPTDGFVDPYSIMQGFNRKAREQGARIELETEVVDFTVEHGRITGVVTNRGTSATPVVVNAAGAWSHLVGRKLGVDIPIRPTKRQIVTTERFDELPRELPMLVDLSTGCYMRKEGDGVMLGWADPNEPESFDTTFNPDFIDAIIERALPRVPCLDRKSVV